MSENLPRLSKTATARALRTLAVAKAIKDRILPAERAAKEYLASKAMEPKDRKSVLDDEGREVATVSLTAGRKKPGTGQWAVTDGIALAAWCDAHGIQHGGTPTVVFPEWFTAPANLDGIVRQHAGEVPEGLAWVDEETSDPSVVVRQTPSQQDNLLQNFQTTAALLDAVTPQQEEQS